MSQEAFVTKINPAGSALVYSTFLGGASEDFGCGIAVDAGGNAYLTGQTHSADFPVAAALQGIKSTGVDFAAVFVAKLNPAGTTLQYSTYLGGTTEELCGGLAIDAAGNAYVTGTTESSDFPTRTPLQAAFAGGVYDGFISKLNPAGSALVYSTYLGGTDSDFGNGVAVDGAGNAYLTGATASKNFPTKVPLQPTNKALDLTVFVSKLNAAGTVLTYSTYLGGTVRELGSSIAADAAGNAYVTGFTSSPDFRVASPVQAFAGLNDAFVSVFNSAGAALTYSTTLGGAGDDFGTGIVADSGGNAYVTGESGSWNFPTPATAFQPFLAGTSDAFVSKLALSGTFPAIKPKIKSDAVLLAANTTSANGCGGVAFDSARTLTVTDLNGDGLLCPGCGPGNTYAPADGLDFVRLAFFGIHHDAAKTRNCNSDVRRTLVASYANLFQGACAAGTCAGKPLRHLWHLDEQSPTTDVLNGLLGTTTAQYCNVNTATVVPSAGTDFLDNDPIRVTCDGTGKTGEQVCGSAADGHTKNLGLVLPLFVPDIGDFSNAYPTNFCTAGASQLMPATKPTYTGLCPAGNPSFLGKCFSGVFRQTLPDGTVTTDANCIQFSQVGACPPLTPASVDCRGANLWLRNSDGTMAKDTTFPTAPVGGRLITATFYKIHATVGEPNGTGPCAGALMATDQIACLAATADPCSIGLVSRGGLSAPLPANMTNLAVKGVLPDNPGVYYGTYPLAF
jgi:hypothetical protein